MKKHTKKKIRNLINLEEKDGVKKSLERLNKRLHYLKSKLGEKVSTSEWKSRQIDYINFHIRKLKRMQ